MRRLRFIEAITTRYLIHTILLVVIFTISAFVIILREGWVTPQILSIFVDIVVKTIALIAGVIWALNRYYTGRTDIPQLRVDSDVSLIQASLFGNESSGFALLIYRLDVINTGTSLIAPYEQYLEINSVSPSAEGIESERLYRWPKNNMHSGGPIEPGSWAAINNAISVPAYVRAIRLYLQLQLADGTIWNWHKTFDVSKEEVNHVANKSMIDPLIKASSVSKVRQIATPKQSQTIEGKSVCGRCNGTGNVACSACGGGSLISLTDTSYHACGECQGTGQTVCPNCSGTGLEFN